LWHAAVGLACLDAAFACLIALAAHPPPRSPEIHFALAPRPLAPPPRVVVRAEPAPEPAPAPPPVARGVTVAIRAPAPRVIDVAALEDGAGGALPIGPSRVDRIDARAPGMRVADAAARAAAAPTRADRLVAAPATIASLEDPTRLPDALADALAPRASAPTTESAPAQPARALLADRLVAPPLRVADVAPRRRAVAGARGADRLMPSAGGLAPGRDEIAWSVALPAWSSEPAHAELSPTARPSPAVLLARWAPDQGPPLAPTGEMKTQFVRLVLPLIMQVNEEILRKRERVVALAPDIEAARPLSEADARFVADVLQETRLDAWDADELLLRLDAVPLSMALAQAAQESGWGRSRPAREDNALFGQMMFQPAARPQVQPFADLLETVNAYARNLNSHRAYADFRRHRAALRAKGDTLDGHALVAFIQRYSERGPLYVNAIRHLMRINNLSTLDASVLDATLDGASLDAAALDAVVPVLDAGALDRAFERPEPPAAEPLSQGMDN
jgi:uncharacterized FlgJ-related protein